MKKSDLIHETEITVIGENVHLDGILEFSGVVRVYGKLSGTVKASHQCSLILMESAVVEGSIEGDSVVIAGFVRGDIRAKSRVAIEGSGRMIGDIDAPSITIDFGAYLEGETRMSGAPRREPEAAKEATSH